MPFLTQGKTNWKYILIVVILAVIVGGGILSWIKMQEVPPAEFPEIRKPEKEKVIEEETAELIPSEVEEWKTYRNEEYGFEIRYPNDWYIETEVQLPPATKLMVSFQNYPPEEWSDKEDSQLIVLSVEESSLNRLLEKMKEAGSEIQEITVNSEKGYKATTSGAMKGYKTITIGIHAVVAKNNYLHSLLITFPNEIGEKIFDQMLSTFRFIE